jgi:hypothetical protein
VRPSSWLVIDPDCGLAGSSYPHNPGPPSVVVVIVGSGVPPVGSAQIFRSTAIVN